jgi:selenocysteine lyase/cysteine desulfurase
MHIDYLSAGGHKWLLGPEGMGIFFCRLDLLDTLTPEVGAMNVINATDYSNIDFTLRPDAKRFECGGYNLAGAFALGASLGLILEVGIPTLWARIHVLTQMIAEGVARKGYTVFSPRAREDECSGILSFSAPDPRRHGEIIAALERKHVILVEREKRLRAAPHFYQSEEQIQALINALP